MLQWTDSATVLSYRKNFRSVIQLSSYEGAIIKTFYLRKDNRVLDYLHMKWSLTRRSSICFQGADDSWASDAPSVDSSDSSGLIHSLQSVHALGFATTALFPPVYTKT